MTFFFAAAALALAAGPFGWSGLGSDFFNLDGGTCCNHLAKSSILGIRNASHWHPPLGENLGHDQHPGQQPGWPARRWIGMERNFHDWLHWSRGIGNQPTTITGRFRTLFHCHFRYLNFLCFAFGFGPQFRTYFFGAPPATTTTCTRSTPSTATSCTRLHSILAILVQRPGHRFNGHLPNRTRGILLPPAQQQGELWV